MNKFFKNRAIKILTLIVLSTMGLSSCKKDFQMSSTEESSIETMVVDPSFTFSTTNSLNLKITTLDNTGSPVEHMPVKLLTDFPDKNGELILSGATNSEGVYSVDYRIPSWRDSLVVATDAIGFVNMQKVRIDGGAINVVLGGRSASMPARKSVSASFRATSSIFQPIGTYNTLGVPNYLTTPDETVDAALIKDLNATLPEGVNLPATKPQYFNNANTSNLHLLEASDVYVSFVHEGTNTLNTLAYYKYTAGKEPQTPADIDSLFVIFPNTSYSGSGGGLASGNRVKIGTFPKQTYIGWALIKGGFVNGVITPGKSIFYSDKGLNPESSVSLKKHTVFFNDLGRAKFLLAFEDVDRTTGNGSDNDFNDVVFNVITTPVSAGDPTDVVVPVYSDTDKDKDGISDNFDAYPDDATKAFNNYYPAKGTVGTLAFEDSWPHKGDYDLNDMVIDYNFNQVTNAKNEVVQVIATLILKAIGASYHSGFGIELPISPDLIKDITGAKINNKISSLNPNGTEAGQSNATIIAFDDAFNVLPYPGGKAIGVNTTVGEPYVNPVTITITINLTAPVSIAKTGTPPYNPFIFQAKNRATEIHLVDHSPTDLADKSMFGTFDDNTNPSASKYYVTPRNLPFAIDIAGPFDYPAEKQVVTKGYTKFYDWSVSGGMIYYDWYKPLNGYRNIDYIFSHQ